MRRANASRKLAARAVSFSGVLFRQFVDDDLGCASYLIGDPSKGEAFLVDPAYAIEQYLEAAEEAGVRIVRVLETHTHADHVSGHGRFALEHGVPTSVHQLAEPEFAFDPLEDGQDLPAGSVPVHVVHTPGHRPEHSSSATQPDLTWPSRHAKAQKACSIHCNASSSSRTDTRSIRATSRARCAVRP